MEPNLQANLRLQCVEAAVRLVLGSQGETDVLSVAESLWKFVETGEASKKLLITHK